MSSSVIPLFIVVFSVIFVDIFCADVTNTQSSNPWQNQPRRDYVNPQFTKSTTTPWPALGPRTSTTTVASKNQRKWVQQNNLWVKNTQVAPSTTPKATTNSKQASTQLISHETNSNNRPLQNDNGWSDTRNLFTQKVLLSTTLAPKLPTPAVLQQSSKPNMGVIGPQPSPSTPVLGDNTKLIGSERNDGDSNTNPEPPTGGVTSDVADNELREFSEELLRKDVNNAAKYVTINYQGMTTSRAMDDAAPLPLLSIDNKAFSIPSIEKMMALYNNYILETTQNEVYTGQEKIEENNLLDVLISTPVMQYTRSFLISKGKLGKDPKEFKDILRLIWFNMYSRGGGRIGSSGFEHVFLAEIKKNQVSGLHNWIYFNEEESKRQANYLGYMKKLSLGDKGAILKYHFTFHDIDKPVGSMFIGTSPELEMALYSTCFLLRADRICPLKMNGNRFIIRTYTYRYRSKNMIGSAFPEI